MFQGSMVALATPMQDDTVDEKRLRDLVEFHIDQGTHAIVAAGTTGESGTLSLAEKHLVIKTVVEQAKERIPIIAGTGHNATRDCVVMTEDAMRLGAHAALIMTPAYIKPTQEGLYRHYQTIAQSVAIPIILYNVPGRTACDLLPETAGRLSKFSNIVGIKEASTDEKRLKALLDACEDRLDIFSGEDGSAAMWMLSGAKGVISVTANVAPRLMAKMADFALQKDKAACLEINDKLAPLHQRLFIESNPIPVKWALFKMGLLENEIRPPLTTLSKEAQAVLEPILSQLQLI